MRRKIWKQFIAWMLIIAIVGGYGNTAMAAGVGDVGQLAEGEESGLSGENGSEVQGGTGEEGEEPSGNDSTEQPEAGGSEESGIEETEAAEEEGEEQVLEGIEEISASQQAAESAQYEPYWENPNFSNLIVFVDFADTTHEHPENGYGGCYKPSADSTFKYFNGTDTDTRGMRTYLDRISYGQLRVENMFPQYDAETNRIVPYQLSQNGSYYAENESAMIQEVIEKLNASGQLADGMELSLHTGGGILDNLTIVVPCDAGNTTKLFSGYHTKYAGSEKIKDCLVRNYNILTEGGIYFGMSGSGVIIHELLHTLGYPDMYRSNALPVWQWDIMATESYQVQYPLAYLRSVYSGWFEMPTVTESKQGVSLYAASETTEETKDQQALILKTDYSDTEYFVVEFRKKGNSYNNEYESKIPGSGLIVYRVNEACETNISGPPDLLYVFRPGDTTGSDGHAECQGEIENSFLSLESGRTSYGSSNFSDSLAEGAITYSDGTNSGIVIRNVGSAEGDQITFDIEFHQPDENTFWTTLTSEEEGADTQESVSCMSEDGILYHILRKSSQSSGILYRSDENGFTSLGAVPSGSSYQLVCQEGALYAAYLSQQYRAKLARWDGSSWKEIYTSPREASEISLTSDSRGVYLAYAANADQIGIYAVRCEGTRVSEMGSQVCISDFSHYACNPSIAAENGTIAVFYREAFNGNKLFVRKYDSASNSWNIVGNQTFSGSSGLVRIHNRKLYLMASGNGSEDPAYLYRYDLEEGGSWTQVGNGPYATGSLTEMDLAFIGDEPYAVCMSSTAPYITEVYRLTDGQWAPLGTSVAREILTGLRIHIYRGKVYVTYRNSVNNRVFVRVHDAEYQGTEEGLVLSPEYESLEGKNPFQLLLEKEGNENGIALFSEGVYTDSFRSQLDSDLALEMYDALVLHYVTNRLTGEQQITLNTPLSFEAMKDEKGNLVPKDTTTGGYAELVQAFYLAYGAFYMDHPTMFWMSGLGLSYTYTYSGNESTGFTVTIKSLRFSPKEYYSGESAKVAAYDTAVRDVKKEIDSRITRPGNRYETVQELHDYLCETLSYDTAAGENLNEDEYNYAHTSSTSFLGYNGKKEVVCEGYAKAFKVLCDQWNIPCVLVMGNAGKPGGTQGAHMWNYVQMEDGKWYAVDVTWDDQTSGICTEYFLAGSTTRGFYKTFAEEHQPNMNILNGYSAPLVYPVLAESAYTAEISPYDWRLEYGYTYAADGTEIPGRIATFITEADLTAALKNELSQTEGMNIRIRYEGEEQPAVIPADLLEVCARKGLNLEYSRWEEKTETSYTWSFKGLSAGEGTAFEDYDLGVSIITANAEIPMEFAEGDYIQVILKGKLPACESASLFIWREGIVSRFTGSTEVYQWKQKGDSLIYQEKASWDKEEENWLEIRMNGDEADAYVLTSQFTYGWLTVLEGEGEEETRHVIYIENRTGKRLTGWQIVEGRKCYFDTNGYLAEGPAKVDGIWYLFGSYADGTQGIRTGYQTWGEGAAARNYYANTSGVIQKGWQRLLQNGAYIWHYFSPTEETYGEEIPSGQQGYWVTISSEKDEEGNAVAGEMAGRRYYFRNNSSLLRNWQTIDGKRYFFTAEGYATTGWYPNASTKNAYFFNELGQMQTGYVEITEGEKTYHCYFNTSGVRQYGWQRILENGSYVWHYFQPDATLESYGQEVASVNTTGYWYTMEGNTYYFSGNSRLGTGWQTIAVNGTNCRFYFDGQGRMCQDTWKIGSYYYHFRTEEGQEGVLGTGLFIDAGKTYYANSSGVLQRGWQKIDGIWRFFDYTTGAEEAKTAIGSDYWTTVTTGTEENPETVIFYFLNGTKIATGWQTIEGRRYYFDGNGILQTGFFKVGSNTYYGREMTETEEHPGEVVTGPQTIGGKDYYFGTNYVMYVGWQKVDSAWCFFSMAESSPERGQKQVVSEPVVESSWYWYTVNGEKYCFRSNSSLLKSWQTINGQRYYLDPVTGAATVGKTLKIGSYVYCFDTNGIMQKNTVVNGYGYNGNGYRVKGWQKLNNEWHYFDAATNDPEDWKEVPSAQEGYWVSFSSEKDADGNFLAGDMAGQIYYFRNNSSMVKGWQTIDGKRYYFDAKTGVLQTGNEEGLFVLGNYTYYLGQDGALRYGWIRETEGKNYYANTSGVLLTGWQKIDNLWYYFCKNTKQQDTSAYVRDDYFATATEGGETHTYYFINGTSLARGWQTIEGKRYYFDTATYQMQTGFFKVGNYWYYYNEDRSVKTGWWENPENGSTYYFNASGMAVTGWQTIKEDGVSSRYYFDANGIMQTQRTKIGNNYYFFGPDGKMRTGFVKYCDTTYYFNGSGVMLKGWQTISGQRYYFDAEGAMQTGFVKIGTATYYFDEKSATIGQMLKGVQEIGGKTYYFNTSGVRLYGWQRINNVWRFFELTDGYELETETDVSYWVTIHISETETEKSFINNGTSLLKGWQTIGGKRYYFDGNGLLWTGDKGWLTIGSTRYYFNEDGSVYQGFLTEMEEDETVHIWYLNGNGQMLKGWQTLNVDGVSGRYYFDGTTGTAWLGHQKIGNYWYYFNPSVNGKMAVGYIQDTEGNGYYYNGSGIRQTGWQRIDGVWKYFDPSTGKECPVTIDESYWATITLTDGTTERAFIRNGSSVLKGWQTINGLRYYFDANGFQWTESKSWLIIGSNRYYFDKTKDNSVYQGFLELKDADNQIHTYYLNANGQLLKGWQTIKVNNVNGRYYLDTTDGEIWMGHQKVGSTWYYFDPTDYGKMATGYIQDVDGDFYYYNTNGALLTGWQKLKGETDYRYFDAAGDKDGTRIGVERTLAKETQTVVSGRYTYTYRWYTIADEDCTVNGSRYCFYNNASLLKNRQTIDGKYYWFHSSTGALYTGYFAIGQNRYYSNADGTVYTGFDPADTTSAGDISYYNIYGQRITGWLTLKNTDGTTDTYYFNANGVMLKGICWIGSTRYVFNPVNGKLVRDKVEIGGKTYYANTNGTLKTGWNRFYENGTYVWCCLSATTGEYLETGVDTSMPEVSRYVWYQVTENGRKDTYCIYNNSTVLKNYQNIGGKRYYFDTTGKLQKDWFLAGSTKCYSDPESAVITGGFREIGGSTYYLNTNGAPLKGWQRIYDSVRRIYEYYYFDTDGKRLEGFQTISSSVYYLNDSLSDRETGARITGNVTIGDSEYYFNGNGVMQTGWFRFYDGASRTYIWKYFGADGKRVMPARVQAESPKDETNRYYQWYQVNGDWYCIYNNSSVVKNFANIGTWRYYFDSKTGILETGAGANGIFTVGTAVYYCEPGTGAINRSGKLLWQGEGENRALSYFDGNGKRYTGWLNLRDSSVTNRYYFQTADGTAASGPVKIGNYVYYFDPETCILQRNAQDVIQGKNTAGEEAVYYTGRYEYLLSGWQKVGQIWYYFDPETKEGSKAKGWIFYGGNRYYVNEETGKVEPGFKTFETGAFAGNTYYFDVNGLMRKGWISLKNTDGITNTYYFNANGILLKGICWIGNTRYVFDPVTGARITDSVVIGDKTYYANTNGTLKTGWQKIYNSTKRVYEMFYFGTDGQKYTGWQEISGKTYYLGADGVMQTGQVTVDGSSYYFNGSGVMQTGWFRFYDSASRTYYWNYYGADGKQITPTETTDVTPKGEQNRYYRWYTVEEPVAESGEKVTNRYCIYNNSSVVKNFANIGSWRYYFDPQTGRQETGSEKNGLFTVGTVTYYCEPGTGAINRSGCILWTNERNGRSLSYFDGNGKRYTGWLNLKVDGVTNRYYFQPSDGKAAAGCTKIGNYLYYFEPDTKVLQRNAADVMEGVNANGKTVLYYTGRYEYLLSGWQKVNGTWYWFDSATKEGSIPEKAENNWITLNGDVYYFRNGSSLVKGWQTINVDGVNGRYYFDGNGILQKGLFTVGSSRYYTNEETGKAEAVFKTFSGKTYYFDGNGLMRTGWISVKGADNITRTYYFNGNGEMLKGICWIGSTRYVFDPVTGERITDSVVIDGKTYYANTNGTLKTGWVRIYNSTKRVYEMFYFGTDGQKYTGWQEISGKIYYLNEDGVMQTGLQTITWTEQGTEEKEQGQEITATYYFNASGVMQTGWFRFYENRIYLWRYFGADGKQISLEEPTDLTPEGQKYAAYKWYTVEEPDAVTGETVTNQYCIYNNSSVLKGFYNIGSWRYYFDSKMGVLQKGLFAIGTTKYYSKPDTGAINRSGLLYTEEETGERYYFDGNGKQVTGWLTIRSGEDAGKYYFNTLTGAAYRGGWYYIDNVHYLFDIEGKVREVPTIASVVSNNYMTATVTWKEVAGAKSYILEYAKDAAFTEPELLVIKGSENLSTEIRGLEEGVRYYFRLKYTLESKKTDEVEESVYSAVKNLIIQTELSPTSGAGSFQKFTLAETTNPETEEKETGIQAEFFVKGRIKGYEGDGNYYLVRVDTYSNKILSEPLIEISKDEGVQDKDVFRFAFEMTLPYEYQNDTDPMTQVIMSKYALAVKSGGEKYTVISSGVCVSNPEYVTKYETPYLTQSSKKGLQDAIDEYVEDSGTKHVLLNLDLKSVYRGRTDRNGKLIEGYETNESFTYKGITYYFNEEEVRSLQSTVSDYNKGTYKNVFGNIASYGGSVNVSLVVLTSYRTDYRRILVHPSARSGSSSPYYTLNSSTTEGQELYEAMFTYLGEKFGQDDCYVSNWILGNEVNSCNAWNYKGSLGFNEYVKCYATSFRQLYNGVKATRKSSRVFISLDNAWNRAVAGYTGKSVLDTFASYINAENSSIEWNVAFHPYSAPLTRTDFWNDYSNTTNSTSSPFISMRNLTQLTNYLGTVEQKYGKASGSIRLILSEQGWTSSGYGEATQAKAIAWAYYIAEFNDRVDTFIMRTQQDAVAETRSGLYMGLLYSNETKKTSYYVYKYMDTPRVTSENPDEVMFGEYNASKLAQEDRLNKENVGKFTTAQNILLNTNWSSLLSSCGVRYDEAKLNTMPYGKLE